MTEILILVNPRAGTAHQEEVLNIVNEFKESTSLCNIEVDVIQNFESSQRKTREAVKKGYYAVVIVGGDGTANAIGAALKGSNTALGIVPAGSGNGVARHIGMSGDIKKALAQILLSKVVEVDTLMVNNHFCLGVAGIGFEAAVAETFAQKKKRGLITYSTVAMTEYFKYKPKKININIDSQEITRTPFTMTFANTSQWGNEFKIAPKASMRSGDIQIVVISSLDEINVMPTVYGLISGNIDTMANCETIIARKAVIESPNLCYHIDGENMPKTDRLEVEINPKSLKILSPKKKNSLI